MRTILSHPISSCARGGSLAVLAHGVTQTLFPSGPFSLAMTGSLWDAGPILTDVFAALRAPVRAGMRDRFPPPPPPSSEPLPAPGICKENRG